ncbi:sugar ABC transporter substrate-binding protein [Arsenicitalea aurantiaca]|uniref:Sugar ABC transporter substrate-binding protein n=1 Tax=Arsenicitalea aurantiaca TaxID=1783274 RepID=A0A433XF05_9HYPH|nr:sugar ABC transporter substrate-binding protein [Arsenicitalea aurantiaca]RUT32584.1 sugar ABC transporter substrate-binding protein [Arsenicitalea aurantiaca]
MDRRHFLILSSTIALVAGVPGLALAQPASDITATLNVFRPATDTDIQLTEAAMARFAERYPNVTINPQYVPTNPWGEYINQMMNSLGGNSSPDIVMMATEGVSTLGSRNVVRDIMPFVEGDPEGQALFEGIEPNLLNGLRYGEMLGYVPNEWNTVVNYYNTAMFEEAGLETPPADWDWDQFLETAKALTKTDASGNVTQYGYFVPGGQFGLNPWFLNNGTDRLTPDGRESNVRDPAFRETLEFLHSLIFEHKVSPTFVRNDYGHGPFIAGQVAMFSGTHGRIPEMISAGFDTVAVQYFPRKTDQVAIMGVGGFGITEASQNPELAWEFVKELTGTENSEALADLMRALPPQRAAATSAEYVAFPANSEIFYGSAPIARSITQPPNFAEVEAIVMRHIEAYLTGNREIDETIDALDTELSRAMSRVRW